MTYSLSAALHNHDLIARAENLMNNFLMDKDNIMYAVNPDGTLLSLQKGVKFISISEINCVLN